MASPTTKKRAVEIDTERLIAKYGSPYLTTAQFAQVFQIGRSATVDWRNRGVGPKPVKAGTRYLYSARAIAEFLNPE